MRSSRSGLAVLLAVVTTGCLTARPDARIAPGGRLGVVSTAMATPDAETYTPDAYLIGVPERYPAAPARVSLEPFVAYGWRRVELLVRGPSLRLPSRGDEPEGEGGPRIAGAIVLDLYAKLFERERWHGGLGVETAGGGYGVATYAWSRRDATSLTARALYQPQDGTRASPRRNVQVQVQASYVFTGEASTVSAFVGAIAHVGDGHGNLLHEDFGFGAAPSVTFKRAVYAGLGVAWP